MSHPLVPCILPHSSKTQELTCALGARRRRPQQNRVAFDRLSRNGMLCSPLSVGLLVWTGRQLVGEPDRRHWVGLHACSFRLASSASPGVSVDLLEDSCVGRPCSDLPLSHILFPPVRPGRAPVHVQGLIATLNQRLWSKFGQSVRSCSPCLSNGLGRQLLLLHVFAFPASPPVPADDV